MKASKKLNTRPTRLSLQLAAALGLGVGSIGVAYANTTCTTVNNVLTCTGDISVERFPVVNSTLEEIHIGITGNYNLTGPKGIGLYVNGGDSKVTAGKVNVSTNGIGADGIRLTGMPSIITFAGAVTIDVKGLSGDGINATVTTASDTTLGDNAHITVNRGVGVRANLSNHWNGRGNKITLGDKATIITKSGGVNSSSVIGYAVYAGNRDSETTAMPQTGSAHVIIGNNSTIQTSGDKSYAVFANKTGQIQLGSTAITTTGKGAHGIVALDGTIRSGGVTETFTGGQVYLTGDTAITVDASKGSYAMYSSGIKSLITSGKMDGAASSGVYTVTGDLVADREGVIQLNSTAGSVFNSNINAIGTTAPSGTGNTLIDLTMSGTQLTGNINASASGFATLNASANSIIAGNITANTSGVVNFSADHSSYTGDVTALDNGNVQMTLKNGALFTGMVDMANAAAGAGVSAGVANITMDGAGTHWQMTNDSNVRDLILTNGAQISIGDQTLLPVTSANKSTLILDNLSGTGGIFNARTEMCHDEADLLIIKNSSSGDHYLHFDDAKSGAYFGAEEAMVVHFLGSDLSLNQATFNSHGVDVGAYVYTLEQKVDSNWYLNTTPTTPVEPPPINNTGKHSADVLNINYLLNHAENQTLLQRMGELRSNTNNQGDVWGRVYTGQLDKFAGTRLSAFDMDYTGVQFGVDKRLEGVGNGEVYIGVMAGAGKADADYAVGSADTKSYHMGAYGTYKTDDGLYVDGFVKYVRMDNDFNTTTSNGYNVTGDGHTTGYSIGVEVGKRFYISQPKQGWYLEPQGQLTFSHQNGATINSSTGLRTDLDSYNSTLGRVSIIAGYSIVEGKNPVDVYVKTGYVREFSGDTGYTFNQANHERYDFGGGWWDNGIGANMQIADRHNVYIDASYAKGGSFDKKQLNLGYRFDF